MARFASSVSGFIAVPMLILICSAVRSPISREYFLRMQSEPLSASVTL